MNKKERKEEKELVNRIKDFKRLFRDSFKVKLLKEREEKHKKGKVFYKGFWIPQEKISNIQKALSKRGYIVFFEIHFLVFIFILLNIFLWIVFRSFLLP
jgi:hypothetical protein